MDRQRDPTDLEPCYIEIAMQVILTHEQADFDALASLLGAYILNETALPVLPRRMNRNVRAFLTLYGVELPFIDPRDLPGEVVDKVILVDTQSLVSVKGMVKDVQVHIIDHHPLREDLSLDWTITVSGTGANTTWFVEMIREHDIALNLIQATLLLLGIYEDTGSLTYDRTTARDLRAAGYLLDQGANLQIAADFLNHPLSVEQQKVYERLRKSAEHLHVNGYTVIVACGDAQEVEEELSTIAHKMRDLLDPDALFLLVATRGGVQLIARSTSEKIDVADIASHFGGGGHERAAAGLIKDQTVSQVQEELLRILPEHIQPAITVAQIMSRGPQVLAPDTTVEEAADQMSRFGHEGYPVVGDGKVIGLLTRRAVDRAMTHKLNLTAASLMEAGDYTVKPEDSIEQLQRLMTDSGWGQIPVIDPERGEIVGIVTRTDLIKTFAPRPRIPGRQNLSDRLERAMPSNRLSLLRAVADEADRQHAALYIVGGFVRDLLLERPSLDFDLVVEGDAIALADALARKFGGRVTSHGRFGTAKWHLLDQSPLLENTSLGPTPEDSLKSLDLVSARTEFYTYPTALPIVERGSIKLDLHRRDFTINTLALRLDGRHYGELHDYWGGLTDLRLGLVRVLHSLSFVDDPTRILRAVRFEQRFDFRIEERTLELMHQATSLLERVSGDRIRHELDHILVEDRASLILERLDELNLLTAILPDLRWDTWFRTKLASPLLAVPTPEWRLGSQGELPNIKRDLSYTLWFLRLPMSQLRRIVSRLKFSAELRKVILAAHHLWQDLPKMHTAKPSAVVERLQSVPRMAIYAVYLASEQPESRQKLYTYISEWQHLSTFTTGHDLRRRGIPPGPIYRQILNALREGWLDGKIKSQDEEIQFLEELIARGVHPT